ncbi:MAG: ATP-binding cassette domain-containing protein [Gammaproteobacteria bacterium]|nr:ATP-binding cassette domain-containing protein [Gammaproteobacteria bacterium]
MSSPLLELREVSVHFPLRGRSARREGRVVRAVDGVSVTLQPGETVGVVGESGCGKSTLARSILRLVPISGGQIFWQGRELTTLDETAMREVRREIRMVFQDPFASLNPRMTVGELVREPLDLFAPQLDARARRLAVGEMLERVGLDAALAARYPHEFSGGQCQRINIARALIGGPKLLICDESVSALDVSIRSQILNLLVELQAATGVACLFISHDLSVIRHVSDRVLVLYLGRTMECREATALFAAPRHPYTRALLDAAPIPDPVLERQRVHRVLGGDLPSPIDPPSGCVFRTRCARADTRCAIVAPALQDLPGGAAACHHLEE